MSLFGSGRREGLLAVLTLLLLSVALHAPALFLGMPRMAAQQSSFTEHSRAAFTNQDTLVPAMRAAGLVVRDGEFPLWNSASRFGEPFLTSGAPILYPPFWLLMLEGGANILDLLLCLHTFLAAMCMFRFCRSLPTSRYVSFLAGALYGLGWFLNAQLDRLPEAAAAAILPLALELTRRMVDSRARVHYAGALSVVLALMFATNGTGTATLGAGLCAAIVLHGVWALDGDNRRRAGACAAVSTLLAGLLTAPLWTHALDHADSLARPAQSAPAHLQPGGLLGVLTPGAFGGLGTAVPESLAMVNPSADPLELVLYPGALVLFLGILGLTRPKRTSHGLFWIGVGGAGLLLSVDTPIRDAIVASGWIHPPEAGVSLVLVHIAFIVLAAAAFESFFEAPTARPRGVQFAAGLTLCVTIAILLAGFAFPDAGTALLRASTGTTIQSELLSTLSHIRSSLLPGTLAAAAIAVLFLVWRPIGLMRFKLAVEVLVIAELLTVAVLHTPRAGRSHAESHWTARLPESAGRAIVVGRDTPIVATPLIESGTPTLTTTSPTILTRTHDYLTAIDPSMVLVGDRVRVLPVQSMGMVSAKDELLRAAGVGIALTGTPHSFAGFESVAPTPAGETHVLDAGHVHYRIAPPRRARVCFEAVHVSDRQGALEALKKHGEKLDRAVILEGAEREFQCAAIDAEPEVTFLVDRANLVRARVDMGRGRGFLVLADAFAPGWTATVDGKPTPIHPANVGFRAVPVPEGIHEITWTYSPALWRFGVPIAAFGLVLLLAWLIRPWVRS